MTNHVADPADEAGDNAGATFEGLQDTWLCRQAELHRYAARRLTERRVLTEWLDADDVVQSWP